MKGTDVTQEQIDYAEQLYRKAAGKRADEQTVTITKRQILILMAWYAAIRCEAVKAGSSKTAGVLVDAQGGENAAGLR